MRLNALRGGIVWLTLRAPYAIHSNQPPSSVCQILPQLQQLQHAAWMDDGEHYISGALHSALALLPPFPSSPCSRSRQHGVACVEAR